MCLYEIDWGTAPQWLSAVTAVVGVILVRKIWLKPDFAKRQLEAVLKLCDALNETTFYLDYRIDETITMGKGDGEYPMKWLENPIGMRFKFFEVESFLKINKNTIGHDFREVLFSTEFLYTHEIFNQSKNIFLPANISRAILRIHPRGGELQSYDPNSINICYIHYEKHFEKAVFCKDISKANLTLDQFITALVRIKKEIDEYCKSQGFELNILTAPINRESYQQESVLTFL